MQHQESPYSPFILSEYNGKFSLLLSDMQFEEKIPVFEQLAEDGWSGNGYDWTSIADLVLQEQLPQLLGRVSFDSEAGMMCALGSKPDLEKFAVAMAKVFHCDDAIRDALKRAQID